MCRYVPRLSQLRRDPGGTQAVMISLFAFKYLEYSNNNKETSHLQP